MAAVVGTPHYPTVHINNILRFSNLEAELLSSALYEQDSSAKSQTMGTYKNNILYDVLTAALLQIAVQQLEQG